MRITNLQTYMPATVSVELEDGESHEIYVLLNVVSRIVLIPDRDQYKLVEDKFEQFVSLLWGQMDEDTQPDIDPFELPDEITERIHLVRQESEEKVADAIKQERQRHAL